MTNVSTYFAAAMMGWLVTLSVLVVGYLGVLELKERREHRRMTEKRQELGLNEA